MKVRYAVGDHFFTHPLHAHEYGKEVSSEPILKLENTLEIFDYGIEPTESVTELENKLVWKLVALNKPIRVMYSGGTDSYSVAHALARNRVSAKYTIVQRDTFIDSSLDGKAYTGFKVKELNRLHEDFGLPHPEVEIIQTDKKFIDEYFADPHFFERGGFYGTASGFSISDFSTILELSKFDPTLYTNVLGMEKPRLYEDGIGIYWQVTDTMTMYGYNPNFTCIWFYLPALLPELIAKQCWNVIHHCAKRWPTLPFNESSTHLQTSLEEYYNWNTVLERHADLWRSLKSRENKPLTSEITYKSNKNYKHLVQYQNEHAKAWQNFEGLYKAIEAVTGSPKIKSILTDRFYVKRSR